MHHTPLAQSKGIADKHYLSCYCELGHETREENQQFHPQYVLIYEKYFSTEANVGIEISSLKGQR